MIQPMSGRRAEGHHIGEKGHLAQLRQPCDGSGPGKSGEAGAVADDVRFQGAVNHGPQDEIFVMF